MIEDVRVAVRFHAHSSACSSGDVLLTLLDEVTDQTVVAKNDHLNLEKKETSNLQRYFWILHLYHEIRHIFVLDKTEFR